MTLLGRLLTGTYPSRNFRTPLARAQLAPQRRFPAPVRLLALTLVLLAAAVTAPAAARAGPGPPLEEFRYESSDLGTAPLSDGVRYFVLHRPTGTVRVVDAETKETRDAGLRSACRPVAAHTGTALIVCHDRAYPFLLTLGTMELASVRNETDKSPQVNPTWQWALLGRHWIGGTYRDMAGHPSAAWIDRRTLRMRTKLDHYPEERDLDDPKLGPARLGWRQFTHEPPWRLAGVVFEPSGNDVGAGTPLILRPGVSRGPRDRRLSSCEGEGGCRRAALSAGLVTWAEPGVVRLYDVRRRVRYGWRIGGTAHPDVVHTRHHVLVGSGPLSWARVRE
jgi:hypothetical protein